MSEDWTSVPSFGPRHAGSDLVVRPSAYGIIQDARGRIAVVRTRQGTFLPGGGIDPGETPEEAARREFLEECGLVVRTGEWSARAVQFDHSLARRTRYEKRSFFFECFTDGPGAGEGEPDHELRWVDAGVAASILTHGSHRWAVAQWMDRTPVATPGPRS